MKYLFLIFCCLTLLSCVKRPENFNTQVDTPLHYPTYFTSLEDGFGSSNTAELRTNSFASAITTLQIADLNERTLAQEGQTVLCYSPKPQTYKIVQQLVNYSSSDSTKTSTSVEFNYSPTTAPKPTTSYEYATFLAELCNPYIRYNIETNAICSDLTVEDSEGPPPAAVQQRPNCGDIPGCKIKKRKISFYRAQDEIDDDGQKIRNKVLYTVVLSSEAPLLAKVLDFCQQGIVQVDASTKIYAKICRRTVNFEKGQSNLLTCPGPSDE